MTRIARIARRLPASRVSKFALTPGTALMSTTIGDWTAGGTGVEAIAGHGHDGLPSLRMATNGSAEATFTRTISQVFPATTVFGFWLYVPDILTFSKIVLRLSTDGTYAARYDVTMTNSPATLRPGWNKVSVSAAEMTATGTVTWAMTMTRMQIRIQRLASPGTDTVCYLSDFRYDSTAAPKILIRVDDQFREFYDNGWPVMRDLGLVGTMYNVTDQIGNVAGDRMTYDELDELYDVGWDMGSHSRTHRDLRACTPAELDDELGGSQQALLDHGYTRGPMFFAYPFGYENNVVMMRTGDYYLAASTNLMRPHWQAHLELDHYTRSRIKCYPVVGGGSSVSSATVNALIDNAVAHDGLFMLLFHMILPGSDDSGNANYWTLAKFTAVMEHLAALRSAGSVDVITMTELWASYV